MKTTVMHNASDFWWSALTSNLSLFCMGLALVLVVMVAVSVGVALRTGRIRRANSLSIAGETTGTATVEFALVFPILLFAVLTLAQTTLVMGGNVFVQYSAFAGARSAIVQIPTDYPDSPANTLYADSTKFHVIERAVMYALVPICGSIADSGTIPPEPYVSALNRMYSSYGQSAPPWIGNLAAKRLAYASGNTSVRVQQAIAVDSNSVRLQDPDQGVFQPKDAVGVVVTHKFNLSLPWANIPWSDGTQTDGRSRYMTLTGQAVLTNEGVLDTMPPLPDLPRNP